MNHHQVVDDVQSELARRVQLQHVTLLTGTFPEPQREHGSLNLKHQRGLKLKNTNQQTLRSVYLDRWYSTTSALGLLAVLE